MGDSGAEYGLVPATQSMRLAIAKHLVLEASGTSDTGPVML